jgi:hypothetical protein
VITKWTIICATLGASACADAAQVVTSPDCAPGWKPEWSIDSSFALCAPPGFTRDNEVRPTTVLIRRASGTDHSITSDLLTVDILSWPGDSAMYTWPSQLASPSSCEIHCITSDSGDTHTDTIAGFPAQIVTGLSSGGMAGWQRLPTIRAYWIVSSNRRALAQGWAASGVGLDTLRQVVGTVTTRR